MEGLAHAPPKPMLLGGAWRSGRGGERVFLFVPLGTTRPRWRTPYVTYGLIVANVLVFWLQITSRDALPPGFIPARPGLFSWFASMFMHGDVFHLGGNMLFLWLFATLTEDVFGPWLLLAVYFGPGPPWGPIWAPLSFTASTGHSSRRALSTSRWWVHPGRSRG